MTLKKETTQQIRNLLRQNPKGLSITAITREIGINRNTAGRYLENLMVSGQVEMRHFGMAKIYRLAQRVPLSAMLSITSELIMLVDSSSRVIYANEPMLSFLGTTQKDLYGRNVEYTPCVTVFDEAFDLLKKKIRGGIEGKEWRGNIVVKNGSVIFSCRIAPAVFEEGQRGASVLLEDITIWRNAEEAIRKSELEFRMLAENTFDIISRHTPDGICLYISPAITHVSGFDPSEIVGHAGSEFIHPDDLMEFGMSLRQMLPDHPSVTTTYRCRHKDGHYIWVESSFRAIFDEKTGQVTEIYGVTRDITDRVLAEDELRESEDRYRALVEISPDAILLHQDGKILYMNPAALQLIRASCPEEVIGKKVLDIVHPAQREKVRLFIQKDLGGDLTPIIELPLIRLDGTIVPVEGRGVRTVIGGSPAVQVTLRDVTERKKTEETLRQSEERYRSLAEASPDLIFVISRADRVEYVNSHAAAMLGMPADQIIGKDRTVLFPKDLRLQQAERLRKVFETERSVRSEGAIPVGGKMHWFDHYLIPVKDTGGKVTAVLGISRDITERKKMEEELRESEQKLIAAQRIARLGDVTWDLETGRVTWSDGMYDLMQFDRSERPDLARIYAECHHPDDLERVNTWLNECVRSGGEKIPPNEYRIIRKDGTVLFVHATGEIQRIDGRPVRVFVTLQDITERKIAEEEIAFKNVILSTQEETSLDAILIVDDAAKILNYNQKFIDMWEVPPGLLNAKIDEPVLQFVMKQVADPEEFLSRVRYLYQHREERSFEEILLRDGRIVERFSAPMLGETGKYYGRVWYFRDISERKRVERALKESEEKLRNIIEHSTNLFYSHDVENRFTYVSPQVEQILGYKPEEVLVQWTQLLTDNPLNARSLELTRRAIGTGIRQSPYEVEIFAKGGRRVWLEISEVPVVHNGKTVAIVGAAEDITEKKLALEALSRSEERFRDLITTTMDIVWETDERTRFVYVSPQVEQILGYHPDELIGRSPFEFLDPAVQEESRGVFDNAIGNNEQFIAYDSRWRHKDGRFVILESRGRPIYNNDRSLIGFRGIDRDVTDQRKIGEALQGIVRTFRMLTENSVDIISRILPDGTCAYISPAVRWSLGFEPEEMIGQHGSEFLHPDDIPHVLATMREFEKDGHDTGTDWFRMRHKDGSYVRFEATIRVIRDTKTGNVKEFTMVSRVTGNKGNSSSLS